MLGGRRQKKSLIILARARTKEGAKKILNNIIWKTGSSVVVVKVIVDRIKSF